MLTIRTLVDLGRVGGMGVEEEEEAAAGGCGSVDGKVVLVLLVLVVVMAPARKLYSLAAGDRFDSLSLLLLLFMFELWTG